MQKYKLKEKDTIVKKIDHEGLFLKNINTVSTDEDHEMWLKDLNLLNYYKLNKMSP